jgi:hypothetical protein
LIDLGLNIPIGLTVQVGEQVSTFVNLGSKNYAKGLARWNTLKGKKFIDDNRALIGKDPWDDLSNAADDIGDKFHKGLFFLFSTANTTANKIHLLGSLTDAEWKAGAIDKDRLAEIEREIGRFRNTPAARSIFGSTSAGKTLSKYKTWALPILNTVVNDLSVLSKMLGRGEVGTAVKSREFQELFRATMLTSLIVLAGKGMDDDDDDDSFTGALINKAYRETLTIIGAIDPTVLSSVRMMSFIGDLAEAVKMIVLLEEYKRKPGYKGPAKLAQTLTPRSIKNIVPEKKKPLPSG